MRAAYNELRGPLRVRRDDADDPDLAVGARKECPLIVGRGDGEKFLASAIPAFLADTRKMQYIENDEIVVIVPTGRVPQRRRRRDERDIEEIDWDEETAEKGGFETFMLKEIHEQSDAVAETVADRPRAATASTSATLARSTRPSARESSASSSWPAARATTPG